MRSRFLLLALVLLAACERPGSLTSISDIKTFPQKYVNTSVTLQGEVTEVKSDFPGSPRGRYVFADDTDPAGIWVRTKELPRPGESFRLTGTVMQDASNALIPNIQEMARTKNRPTWLVPVLIGAAVLCVFLAILLIVVLRSPAQPAPLPMPTPGMGSYAPGGGFAMGGFSPPAADPQPPTVVFEPAAARTQVFLKARLRVTSGADAGKDFPLANSPLHIGRGRSAAGGRVNHVVLTDPTVSSAQATIRHDAAKDTFILVNDSTTNRTVVDGDTKDVAQLESGSTIQAGATTLVFQRD